MSATLGTMLQMLVPGLQVTVVESLGEAAAESSDAWNNAGTGHAALCELNYTPEKPDGSIAIDRAIKINEQFLQSRQFWAALADRGELDPDQFIHSTPHMSFVSGAAGVDFLRRRFTAMQADPLFSSMRYSDDPAQLREWIPLMMRDRSANEPVAATRSEEGTDLDFGALTRALLHRIEANGGANFFRHKLVDLNQLPDRRWYTLIRNLETGKQTRLTARFVFLGAGGGALPLLQKSGIPEGRGYGGFPVSG
ncbi:MAG: FAD-dependent oxidoreductase, partial [Terriglobus roseus]|nr:FAD-dependent oxidoreductase [Terriglobus roseus]